MVTAVILGGASLAGGRGTIIGTVLGLLIIGVLNNGLILLNVSTLLAGGRAGHAARPRRVVRPAPHPPLQGLREEKPMAKLRLGVIGAGSWAVASHLPNLADRRDDVEFVGVARKGPEARRRSATSTGSGSPARTTAT